MMSRVGSTGAAAAAHAEVRLVAHAASVPAARRFVDDALTDWDCRALADEVVLCVSELATNATLHSGSPYFHLDVEQCPGGVRVAVADGGMGAVDVLSRRAENSDALDADLTADDASTTGRGMFLVAALSTAWGIDELAAGKRVWAEFCPGQSGPDDGETHRGAARVTWSAERPEPVLDPDEWAVVRFRGCPAALLIAHDDNLAEYARELRLIGDRMAEPAFQRLGGVLAGYLADHAPNWDPAGIIAHDALRDGRELIDFDILAVRDVRPSIRFLRNLISEAESLSEQDLLITLAGAEPVQRLRDWMEGEFLAQIEDDADPLPYPDWLAGARR